MAPFEALCGLKDNTPICWDDIGEKKLIDLEFIEQSEESQVGLRVSQNNISCTQ